MVKRRSEWWSRPFCQAQILIPSYYTGAIHIHNIIHIYYGIRLQHVNLYVYYIWALYARVNLISHMVWQIIDNRVSRWSETCFLFRRRCISTPHGCDLCTFIYTYIYLCIHYHHLFRRPLAVLSNGTKYYYFLFFSLSKTYLEFFVHQKRIYGIFILFSKIYNYCLIEYSKQFCTPTNLNCRALTRWCI